MDYANPLAARLRTIARRLHVLHPIAQIYRRTRSNTYEDAFNRAMMAAVKLGDTVWDVGANEGIYTKIFSDRVGPKGMVVAFEPSPTAVTKLKVVSSNAGNILLKEIALSDIEGEMPFYINDKNYSPTDSLISGSDNAEPVRMTVKRADEFLPMIPPSIVKIDVEGFEWEVLKGMVNTLSSVGLRAVFIEVHFSALERRGLLEAPGTITKLLRDKGFIVSWTDSSHIYARRKDN
jgi:FkbM family methyltransferase